MKNYAILGMIWASFRENGDALSFAMNVLLVGTGVRALRAYPVLEWSGEFSGDSLLRGKDFHIVGKDRDVRVANKAEMTFPPKSKESVSMRVAKNVAFLATIVMVCLAHNGYGILATNVALGLFVFFYAVSHTVSIASQ